MFYYLILFYMIILLLLLFILFMYFFINKMILFLEFEIMKISSVKLEILLLFDWISLLFMSVVLLISVSVMFYSMEYMSGSLKINQFMGLVILFVMSMMLMILSPNLLSILIGWDGLGLVSFCLVIFYQNEVSFNSGMVTVVSNRFGDIMLLMMIGLMFNFGAMNFMFFYKLKKLLLLMLFTASITKSAQMPFSSWLPMAMAAPTPISALVHSSTLVTAGVYLLIRFNYLMSNCYILSWLMMFISLLTMFLSGLGANFEFDLKKIIALSTLSQLGVMIFSLSLGLKDTAFFHLLTHAMFKSLLFMCCGAVIHNSVDNQDVRYVSMVLFNMPLISVYFNCSTLSLCGLPFLSGFFSKDLILEIYLTNYINKFVLIILFMSMGLTVMYSFRLIYYSFIKVPKLVWFVDYGMFKSKMGGSMYILFILSISMGLFLSWILFSMKNSIYLKLNFKLMIYFWMGLGNIFGLIFPKWFLKKLYLSHVQYNLKFFSKLWFMPYLYEINLKKFLELNESMSTIFEMGYCEFFLYKFIFKNFKNWFSYEFFFVKFLLLFILISYYMTFILMN